MNKLQKMGPVWLLKAFFVVSICLGFGCAERRPAAAGYDAGLSRSTSPAAGGYDAGNRLGVNAGGDGGMETPRTEKGAAYDASARLARRAR